MMSTRPDISEVSARAKLIMDRLIAARIARDPSIVERARSQLLNSMENSKKPEWWANEWLAILERSTPEIVAFVRSTDPHARRLSLSSPFNDDVTGLNMANIDWRKRLLSKALKSLMLARREHEGFRHGR